MKPIHIFKPGKHQDSISGQTIEFTEADVAASIAAYDPAKHEAPITIGHPKSDRPAFGWVQSLAPAAEGGIDAAAHQVDAAFAEGAKAGKYKKVSAAFYAPDSPKNPVPGVWYLRHVAFLGAEPPAVKGLRAVAFAESEEGVVSVEFAENTSWVFTAIARLFRRWRDQVVAEKGIEEADKLVPEWEVASIAEAAIRAEKPGPMFSETETSDMTNEELARREAALAAREQALQTREQTVQTREVEFAERDAQQLAAAARAEAVAFAETLVAGGQLLPRDRDGLVAVLAAKTVGDTVAFGEGDDRYEGVAGTWLRDWLKRLPKQVEFSEVTPPGAPASGSRFRAPAGGVVSPERQALHDRAVAFQEANPNTDYLTAVQAVEGAA